MPYSRLVDWLHSSEWWPIRYRTPQGSWWCWRGRYWRLRPASDRRCRECGCHDLAACPGGCSWVDEDLCSACAGAAW